MQGRGLLLMLALVACNGSTKPLPPTLVAAKGSAGLDTLVPPAVAPIGAPGEQMQYRVSIHGLEVAEFTLSIGAPADLDGVATVVAQANVRTSKVAAWVRQVHDEFTSWIDRKTGRSVQFRSREVASKEDAVAEETTARFTGNKLSVDVQRGDGVSKQDWQEVRGQGGFDMVSFLLFLRAWEAQPGGRLVADVMRSRWVWRAHVVVAGYENLETATMGEIAVVRYDGESERLLRDATVDTTVGKRRWSIWISDDADRVPVKLVARTDYGDVKMDLVGYRPGNTTAR